MMNNFIHSFPFFGFLISFPFCIVMFCTIHKHSDSNTISMIVSGMVGIILIKITKKINSLLLLSAFGMPLIEARTYTTDELFIKLDTNNDGIITPEELTSSAENMGFVNIKNEECSCFRCDGTHFTDAVLCDVYDNSGCDNIVGKKARSAGDKCYTTNNKKCNCNIISKNPYICKIPLTHSFVNFKEKTIHYYSMSNQPKHFKQKEVVYENEMWERADSAFQKGRNSAINDMVDIATTYVIADTITSLMVDSLVDKDI